MEAVYQDSWDQPEFTDDNFNPDEVRDEDLYLEEFEDMTNYSMEYLDGKSEVSLPFAPFDENEYQIIEHLDWNPEEETIFSDEISYFDYVALSSEIFFFTEELSFYSLNILLTDYEYENINKIGFLKISYNQIFSFLSFNFFLQNSSVIHLQNISFALINAFGGSLKKNIKEVKKKEIPMQLKNNTLLNFYEIGERFGGESLGEAEAILPGVTEKKKWEMQSEEKEQSLFFFNLLKMYNLTTYNITPYFSAIFPIFIYFNLLTFFLSNYEKNVGSHLEGTRFDFFSLFKFFFKVHFDCINLIKKNSIKFVSRTNYNTIFFPLYEKLRDIGNNQPEYLISADDFPPENPKKIKDSLFYEKTPFIKSFKDDVNSIIQEFSDTYTTSEINFFDYQIEVKEKECSSEEALIIPLISNIFFAYNNVNFIIPKVVNKILYFRMLQEIANTPELVHAIVFNHNNIEYETFI